MLYKVDQLRVDASQPFAEDRLQRRVVADNLAALVASARQPFVLAINGGWGTGKTTFVRMWSELLKQRGHQTVLFNAWANDFAEDPLLAMISEVESSIEAGEINLSEHPQALQYWQRTKRLGAGILRKIGPLSLKIATQGLVDLEGIKDIVGDLEGVSEDLGSFASELAKERIQSYLAERQSITAFKANLGNFAKSLGERESASGPAIVFIVDELDCCRPLFAIELLERMKHLFDVPGVVFVLAIDRSQLGQSVRALYGNGIDADGYLRRFIDLEFTLPRPPAMEYTRWLYSRYDLASVIEPRQKGQETARYLTTTFAACSDLFQHSLRTQEQCFLQLNVYLRTLSADQKVWAHLAPFLITLRAANEKLYRAYCDGDAGAEKVLTYIRSLVGGSAFLASDEGHVVEAYLTASSRIPGELQKRLADYHNLSGGPSSADEQKHAQRQRDLLQYLRLQDDVGILPHLVERIELTRQFDAVGSPG